ncbi:hypothetical protein SAMN05216390_10924 [Lachnospiraceae bacterium KH1T2]|nr:hypothetical protein SAMN05216390_10924 [Lachnospiraceae bacterium KH1T2]
MINNEKMKELVFNFVYDMALNDATRRTNASNLKNRIANIDGIKKEILIYTNEVLEGNYPKHCNVIKSVMDIVKDKNIEGFTFGNAQKLVNMTMKYLYLSYYNNPEISKYFRCCDAPMDSIMMTFVYECYYIINGTDSKKKGVSNPKFKREGWSTQETDKEYQEFQIAIKNIIEKKKLGISPIEFDYLFWDKAKEAKYDSEGKERRQDERIKYVAKILDEC